MFALEILSYDYPEINNNNHLCSV